MVAWERIDDDLACQKQNGDTFQLEVSASDACAIRYTNVKNLSAVRKSSLTDTGSAFRTTLTLYQGSWDILRKCRGCKRSTCRPWCGLNGNRRRTGIHTVFAPNNFLFSVRKFDSVIRKVQQRSNFLYALFQFLDKLILFAKSALVCLATTSRLP